MIRDLIYYGHPGLRQKCKEIKEITDEVRQLAQDLIDTVQHRQGAGLAAPQIGVYLRMFVSCYDNGADEEGWPLMSPPKIYINPVLTCPSMKTYTHGEGCLSIPGLYEEVTRPAEIHVEAIDLEGNKFTESTTGWRAKNIMHENDHLNGVLYIDRIDAKKRKKMEPGLKALEKKYHS